MGGHVNAVFPEPVISLLRDLERCDGRKSRNAGLKRSS
jgi:hypothetical protein